MFDFLRNWTKSAEAKQQEAITAYLDNALSSGERERFERQMGQDPVLRAEVERQRQTRQLLRQLPPRQTPRNFTLDPALYGRPTRQPLVTYYPALRAATVLTAVLLFFIVGLNIYSSGAGSMANAPDMAVSQFAVETTSEEAAGSAPESDSMAEEPMLESAPPAEPAMPAAESTSMGETAEEETAEEEALAEEPVEGAPAAAEAPAAEVPAEESPAEEAAAVPQATPSPAATLEPGTVTELLPTATVSDLPRLTATEVADRAELAATAVPLAPETDTDTANIAPAPEVVVTAVSAPETPTPPTVELLPLLAIGLLLLLVCLVILTLYARRQRL